MRQIWLLAWNDVRLTVRDRMAFIWMLAMPIAMMWFFGSIGGGGSAGPQQIALDVVSHDDGWLAAAMIEELEDEGVQLRQYTPEEREAKDDKVRTLVFPEEFTRKVLAGEQQVLRLEREAGSSAEFGMAAEVHTTRAIVRTLARLVEMAGDAESADGDGAAKRFRALGERPATVLLEVSTAGSGTPVPGGRAQSVPGMLTFLVMMMTLIYGAVFLTIEKRTGMLRRQAVQPMTRQRILAGKVLGRLALALGQIVLLVLAGRFLFGVSWGDSPLGLALVLVSYATAVAGMSVLLGSLVANPAQASGVGWIGAMVMAALGGCWWPSEVMPRWMWKAAHVFPTAWAMDAFHSLISFGRGVDAVLLPALVLVGFGVASSLVGARFLRVDVSE